jgi:hypothetical protein
MASFNKGDRVVMHVWRHSPLTVGTILSVDAYDAKLYVVEWDKGKYDATTQIGKVAGEYLMSEKDAIAKKTRLEQDFDNLRKAVAPKIEQAAKLLQEAATEVHAAGIGQSVRGLDIEDTLLNAIEAAGWNMSSAHC